MTDRHGTGLTNADGPPCHPTNLEGEEELGCHLAPRHALGPMGSSLVA
jgi:hypothetical protein